MTVNYKEIGKRIRQKRKEKKLTQEALAEKLDITVGYVSQMERGVTKISLERLAEIGAVLDTELSSFLNGTVQKQNSYLQTELAEKIEKLGQKDRQLLSEILDAMLRNA